MAQSWASSEKKSIIFWHLTVIAIIQRLGNQTFLSLREVFSSTFHNNYCFSVTFTPLTSRASMNLASQQMTTTSKSREMEVVGVRTNQSRRRCRQKIRKRNKEIVFSLNYQFTSVLQLVEICAITSV